MNSAGAKTRSSLGVFDAAVESLKRSSSKRPTWGRKGPKMASFDTTSVVNYSAAARQRREQALRDLDLPLDGWYVRGCVPREYLRLMAEEEAAPGGAAQVALCLYGEARRAGLAVDIIVDEYNSPCDIDIKVGGLPTLMVQSCGRGRSYIVDGESGFPVDDMHYGAWAHVFEEVAASKK